MTLPAAFITGGSSGIGLELAKQLAVIGHPIAIFARDTVKLNAAVDVILAHHPSANVAIFPVDVSDSTACKAAVASAIAQLGTPGWAIANAGIAEPGTFLDQGIKVHETHMRINYMGALYFAHAVAEPMSRTGGKLVFVASGAAFFGIYGYSAYTASKFAMRGLAEVLRVELAPLGISVTLAYPPDTDTPMLAAEARTKPDITKTITAGGGVHSASDVAAHIIARARKGKFTAAPGRQMKALLVFHSLIGPALRYWQKRLIQKQKNRR